MFVAREFLKINHDATNINYKTETKTWGRHTVASTAVLSKHLFRSSRSDLPSLFNQNSFIMREQMDKISSREEAALLRAWGKLVEPTGKDFIVPETQEALFRIIYYLLYYQGTSSEDSNNLEVINALYHLRLLYDFFTDYNNYLSELNQN